MTTNSALSTSLRSLRLRRLLAGAGVLAVAAVAFTGSPAWGEPGENGPREKIVFTNSCLCPQLEAVMKSEIYIMNPDGSKPTRLTNDDFGDGLPVLSPDGKGKIVFDSNRIAISGGGTPGDSDLFLINHDGTADGALLPRPLTRGSSASFDPTGKNIAFHRSASDTYGTKIGGRTEPGGPTTDSDIFLVNLDDLEEGTLPVNLTNGLTSTPGVRGPYASDDADWSPDGKWIAFTSRIPDVPLEQSDAGIYVMNLETRVVTKLTNFNNNVEERSPAWSPDGTRIAINRRAPPPTPAFEIWVLGFDPGGPRVTSETRLTENTFPDLTTAWSPTGEKIVFHTTRPPPPPGFTRNFPQIFVMNAADGSNQHALTGTSAPPGALLGQNLFPKWGRIEVGRDPK